MVSQSREEPQGDIHHNVEEHAVECHREAITKAIQSGRWMALVFRAEDDQILMDHTTWKFPKAEFEVVMRMVAEKLEELRQEKREEPLPLADFIKAVKEDSRREDLIDDTDDWTTPSTEDWAPEMNEDNDELD